MRSGSTRRALGLASVAFLAATNAAAQSGPPPATQTITRISLISGDPQRLRRFYVEGLGFIPIWAGVIGEGANAEVIARAWRLAPGARLNGMLLRAPHGDMELQVTHVTGQTLKSVPRVRTEAPLAGDHYFVLHVPDLDAVLARLKPFDVSFNRPPMKMTAVDKRGQTYAVYETVIYDPEGTILILVEDKLMT